MCSLISIHYKTQKKKQKQKKQKYLNQNEFILKNLALTLCKYKYYEQSESEVSTQRMD